MKKKQLISDGLWVAFGQLFAAIGTLVGLRMLTEYVPPTIYGSITLFLAVGNLALGTLFTPIMQAAIKFYAQYHRGDSASNFRYTTYKILLKRLLILFPILMCAWPILEHFEIVALDEYLLLILIFMLDGFRTFESVLLNAARRQKVYALISVMEAWAKPFTAILVIISFGASIRSVLLGYIYVTSLIMLFFYLLVKPVGKIPGVRPKLDKSLRSEIIRYSLPLLPLATVGWLSGVGDRYIIAGKLGMEDVGIYAAVYGLLNRPFMMLAGTIELTLRPIYNQAIAEKQHHKAHNLLIKWLLIVFVSGFLGWALITVFKEFWISLLLAKTYQTGVELMPWIAGGSVLLILSHVFEKVCYGYGRTGFILIIQTIGCIIGLTAAYIGVSYWGVMGVAIAVPVYFGIQLLISIFAAHFARKSAINQPT